MNQQYNTKDIISLIKQDLSHRGYCEEDINKSDITFNYTESMRGGYFRCVNVEIKNIGNLKVYHENY
jgi:hypothetical protein